MKKELDERKVIGSIGVSRYILKDCRQETVETFHYIIECSLKIGP